MVYDSSLFPLSHSNLAESLDRLAEICWLYSGKIWKAGLWMSSFWSSRGLHLFNWWYGGGKYDRNIGVDSKLLVNTRFEFFTKLFLDLGTNVHDVLRYPLLRVVPKLKARYPVLETAYFAAAWAGSALESTIVGVLVSSSRWTGVRCWLQPARTLLAS